MDRPRTECVYVLHGDDAYLLDAHRREITNHVVGDADPQVCISSFDASAELADVLDELRTLPFLAPRRLVIVRDADSFVTAHRQALERFLQAPPSSATLLLLVAHWNARTRLAKLIGKIGHVTDCSLPATTGLPRWLAQAAKRRGKKLAPDAAALLAEWVGRDLAALNNEMEKLSLYAGDRAAITIEDVCAVVTASAGPAAFDLTNAITAADLPAALKALGGMLRKRGDEFKTLGMVAWHLRRAMLAKELLQAGQSPRQALPPMPPHARNAFLALLNRRSLSAFRLDFRRLIRADLRMKSGAKPAAALQELLASLCS